MSDYKLVWSDEFDVDGPPNPEKWTCREGFIGEKELTWYKPQNAYCKNSILTIEARREVVVNPYYNHTKELPEEIHQTNWEWKYKRKGALFTSANLTTKGKCAWQYGRFKMRARIPTASGLWPAWFTIGQNKDAAGFPACGEIDIAEHYVSKGLISALHWQSITRGECEDSTLRPDGKWKDNFHIFGLQWTPDETTFFLDGISRWSHKDMAAIKVKGQHPFWQPHNMYLGMGVGGDGGDPSRTVFPAKMEVDYIRIYQKG